MTNERGWGTAIVRGFALTGALLTTACMSTAPSKLPPQLASAMEGKSIAIQPLRPTDFALVSSSAVLAGALNPMVAGANAAKGQRAGEAIVEQDHLADPAAAIAQALLSDLQKAYGMKEPVLAGEGASAPDFLMSVEVSTWSTLYLPTHLSRYGVMLMAKATLAESKTGKTLREARCVIRPRNVPDAPTFTELLENDGARLRAESDYATGACIEALKHSLAGD